MSTSMLHLFLLISSFDSSFYFPFNFESFILLPVIFCKLSCSFTPYVPLVVFSSFIFSATSQIHRAVAHTAVSKTIRSETSLLTCHVRVYMSVCLKMSIFKTCTVYIKNGRQIILTNSMKFSWSEQFKIKI